MSKDIEIGVYKEWSIEDKTLYHTPVPIGSELTVLYNTGRWKHVEEDGTLDWSLGASSLIVGYIVHSVPEQPRGIGRLVFINHTANLEETITCSIESVRQIMLWYGGYYSGDNFTVRLNGEIIREKIGYKSTLTPEELKGQTNDT